MLKLYSTGCPKCTVLENKLKEKNIDFETITDKELMLNKGFNFLPVLEIDGNMMEFAEAVRWINSQGGQN